MHGNKIETCQIDNTGGMPFDKVRIPRLLIISK